MLLLRGKGPKAPFASLTLVIFLFGRKKNTPEERLPTEGVNPFQIPDIMQKSVIEGDAKRARDRLRIATLERDIIGGALTKIYEAETRGQLSESERTQLVQRYKTDLKRVDSEIDDYKKIVDLSELESAKEDLLKSFHAKLLEIDQRINQIKPSLQHALLPSPKTGDTPGTAPPPEADSTDAQQNQTNQRGKPTKEKPKNKAEERIDAIREEVLKAMERLEQIETEG